MDFIQTANKEVDKFGSGKHGFSAGNPAGGVLATLLSNTWCDAVQQEIINVIEGGGLVASGASLNQMLLALRAMYGAARIGHTYTAPDWVPLGGGLILQYGMQTGVTPGSTVAVTLPVTFPNTNLFVLGVASISAGNFYAAGANTGLQSSLKVYNATGNPANVDILWLSIGR